MKNSKIIDGKSLLKKVMFEKLKYLSLKGALKQYHKIKRVNVI